MQHIDILAVGALKEPAYAAACAEYAKRLGAFCRLRIVEISECRLPKNPGAAQIAACLEAEGAAILAKLPPKAHVIALCIEGGQLTSEQLAATLDKLRGQAPDLAFVIGGSHGMADAVKKRAGLRLSMSRMTFPHQLARVMLLEQVYRAFSITAGKMYHK